MKYEEIALTLDYFRFAARLDMAHARDTMTRAKYEGMYNKLCKGKPLGRDELVWLRHKRIWLPLCDQADSYEDERYHELTAKYSAVETAWLNILNDETPD